MIKALSLLFLTILLVSLNDTFAQSIKKDKDKVDGISFNYYSTQSNTKLKGILILLPSFGEKARDIFDKTTFPQLLTDNGYLTIIPEINNTLFADQYTIDQLNQVIKTQTAKYNIHTFVIGGLSSGGAIAARYAEYLLSKDTSSVIKGVFAIDSPLDLTRIYESALRKIHYSCRGVVMKEGYSIKNQLETALGGPPNAQASAYVKYSSFTTTLADGGNAKFLKYIPIRLYCEPDLDFVKRTYCNDLQLDDINAFDLENLNKYLVKIGNDKAQYITTMDKGFHTWNIIEPNNLVDWIIRISH